ncbi:MAG: hypothetical protein JO248_16520 [Acidimicrobiia bacterium]|nr:hypothetical protein [Acidimicrobiia bacterium]
MNRQGVRARVVFVLALALAVAGIVPAVARQDGPAAPHGEHQLLVGAALADVSPPAFDPKADAAAFPGCPAALFNGPRQFAFEEPYKDVQGVGHFEYPDPFCDANHNGRWDGIYISGGVDHVAQRVHDPIDARAIAVSDGMRTAVVVSVVAQGIHETYTHRVRDRLRTLRPQITDVIVSANHNESSPDTVGIYGAPNVQDTVGGRSGIDDYYMSFLVDRVAHAAAAAYDARQPAVVSALQMPVPSTVNVRLSKNFPTTDDSGKGVALDPKIGVLSAKTLDGKPIVTVMSMAAHNQEIGHTNVPSIQGEMSSDWPGYFHRRLEQTAGGMAMFLVADNGSIEDPETVPPVPKAAGPGCPDGCYAQAQATGEALADAVAAQLPNAHPLRSGRVDIQRDEFYVPLENNLFKAAAAAGLFGDRQTFVAGVPAGPAGTDVRTEVGVIDVGPDLQLLANPGESFPALMVGSHWGVEDASCPERPNPPVPTWHASSAYRFRVGLADDLLGYLIPAWGFSTQPGVFTTTCFNDQNDKDQRGHQHKLESEAVGPTAANLVAQHLSAVLDAQRGEHAVIRPGRFVRADGSLSRSPVGAVGLWLSGSENGGGGLLFTTGHTRLFGSYWVDGRGQFVDYDAVTQAAPDLLTHGMVVGDRTYYADVYPDVAAPAFGPAQ